MIRSESGPYYKPACLSTLLSAELRIRAVIPTLATHWNSVMFGTQSRSIKSESQEMGLDHRYGLKRKQVILICIQGSEPRRNRLDETVALSPDFTLQSWRAYTISMLRLYPRPNISAAVKNPYFLKLLG